MSSTITQVDRISARAFDVSSPTVWSNAWSELAEVSRLRNDWDGEGALSPDPRIVSTAEALLREREGEGKLPEPTVVASPLGRIVFEWEFSGYYLQAEVTAPGVVQWMVEHPDGTFSHCTAQQSPVVAEPLRTHRIGYEVAGRITSDCLAVQYAM